MILPTKEGPYDVPAHVRSGLYAKYSTYGRGVDVDRELALMALWLERNPSRRPKRVLVFIDKWFAKISGDCGDGTRKRRVTTGVADHAGGHLPPRPTLNGAAASTSPVGQFANDGARLLAEAAAPPPIRLNHGARSIADVLAPFRRALANKE